MSGINRELTPLRADGSSLALDYAEIKIVKGGNQYHVIPRTKPRRARR
ncbi:MAG: hypothetical protein SWX82_00960 [Cyanobacteriota bacterium]|nr:hypothetical protein [Cyanobacteriota bacterium]